MDLLITWHNGTQTLYEGVESTIPGRYGPVLHPHGITIPTRLIKAAAIRGD